MSSFGPPPSAVDRALSASKKSLRYDPDLVADLLARHRALETTIAALPALFGCAPQEGLAVAQDCLQRLHELRRWEAIRLYPVVSRGLSGDAVAARQWIILRFVLNGLAHRLLRSMDELGAARSASDAETAAAAALENLRAYRERNEAELYPLYVLMDPCRARISA